MMRHVLLAFLLAFATTALLPAVAASQPGPCPTYAGGCCNTSLCCGTSVCTCEICRLVVVDCGTPQTVDASPVAGVTSADICGVSGWYCLELVVGLDGRVGCVATQSFHANLL